MNRISCWIFILLVLFSLSGCAPAVQPAGASFIESTVPPQATQSQPGPQRKVALVLKSLTNPYFIDVEKGARQAARERGVDLMVRAAAQSTSVDQQIELVEEVINAGVSAIVITPADSVRLIPVLKKARDAGIVVINIDNPIDRNMAFKMGLDTLPFIGPDNEQGAYLAAKVMTEHLTQPTHVAIVEGAPQTFNSLDRRNGALRAFSENHLAQVTEIRTAHWKIDEAYDVARQLFANDPELGAIYCANDLMALGVVKYLDDTGRKNVLVGGFDALKEARDAIREGKMLVSVDQQAVRQGYLGIDYALRSVNGEKFPDTTLVDVFVLTQKDLK